MIIPVDDILANPVDVCDAHLAAYYINRFVTNKNINLVMDHLNPNAWHAFHGYFNSLPEDS